jgi:hypothetical protein
VLQEQIEAQREHLAETVDLLSAKLDVKSQAKERLRRVRPEQIVSLVGVAIVVGTLVWWRRSA